MRDGVLERDRDRRRGAPGIWVEGGGVMSEEDRGGGDKNFLSERDDRALMPAVRSGDGDRVARRTGVAGAMISAGAASGLWEGRVF